MSKRRAHYQDGRYPQLYHHEAIPWGEQCEHARDGMWVFWWKDALYGFYPNTQLQKDCWLSASSSPGPRTHDERIQALRWACYQCGTVQVP